MNSAAFLMLLGSFAVVIYWYVINAETEKDGTNGLLGLRPDKEGDSPLKHKVTSAYSPLPENVQKVKNTATAEAEKRRLTHPREKHFRLQGEDKK